MEDESNNSKQGERPPVKANDSYLTRFLTNIDPRVKQILMADPTLKQAVVRSLSSHNPKDGNQRINDFKTISSSREKELAPIITNGLKDNRSSVQHCAVQELIELGGEKALTTLKDIVGRTGVDELDPLVTSEAVNGLGSLGGKDEILLLNITGTSDNPFIIQEVISALAKLGVRTGDKTAFTSIVEIARRDMQSFDDKYLQLTHPKASKKFRDNYRCNGYGPGRKLKMYAIKILAERSKIDIEVAKIAFQTIASIVVDSPYGSDAGRAAIMMAEIAKKWPEFTEKATSCMVYAAAKVKERGVQESAPKLMEAAQLLPGISGLEVFKELVRQYDSLHKETNDHVVKALETIASYGTEKSMPAYENLIRETHERKVRQLLAKTLVDYMDQGIALAEQSAHTLLNNGSEYSSEYITKEESTSDLRGDLLEALGGRQLNEKYIQVLGETLNGSSFKAVGLAAKALLRYNNEEADNLVKKALSEQYNPRLNRWHHWSRIVDAVGELGGISFRPVLEHIIKNGPVEAGGHIRIEAKKNLERIITRAQDEL